MSHTIVKTILKGDLEGITINHVSRINDIDRFSRMCVYDLPKWVNTEFMILSGMIIVHHEQWTDEFLEYDYVGLLWTRVIIILTRTEIKYRLETDTRYEVKN